jgi:hypothetical protein
MKNIFTFFILFVQLIFTQDNGSINGTITDMNGAAYRNDDSDKS